VAKPDKFFGQVGNDPLSAAIETGRNALNEGSDLCKFHNDLDFLATIANACSTAWLQFHKTSFNNTVSLAR
jgi:hypothetical protein